MFVASKRSASWMILPAGPPVLVVVTVVCVYERLPVKEPSVSASPVLQHVEAVHDDAVERVFAVAAADEHGEVQAKRILRDRHLRREEKLALVRDIDRIRRSERRNPPHTPFGGIGVGEIQAPDVTAGVAHVGEVAKAVTVQIAHPNVGRNGVGHLRHGNVVRRAARRGPACQITWPSSASITMMPRPFVGNRHRARLGPVTVQVPTVLKVTEPVAAGTILRIEVASFRSVGKWHPPPRGHARGHDEDQVVRVAARRGFGGPGVRFHPRNPRLRPGLPDLAVARVARLLAPEELGAPG